MSPPAAVVKLGLWQCGAERCVTEIEGGPARGQQWGEVQQKGRVGRAGREGVQTAPAFDNHRRVRMWMFYSSTETNLIHQFLCSALMPLYKNLLRPLAGAV